MSYVTDYKTARLFDYTITTTFTVLIDCTYQHGSSLPKLAVVALLATRDERPEKIEDGGTELHAVETDAIDGRGLKAGLCVCCGICCPGGEKKDCAPRGILPAPTPTECHDVGWGWCDEVNAAFSGSLELTCWRLAAWLEVPGLASDETSMRSLLAVEA